MTPNDPAGAGTTFRAPLMVLALLTLTAGFADGYALSRYGVFVANQSGNIVHVGMGLVGQDPIWRLSLLSILGFALGGCLAWLVARVSDMHDWSTVRLRLVAGGLLVLVWWATVTIIGSGELLGMMSALLGATAMGVTATALTRVAGVQAQTSFQSGTVLRSAEGLMDWAAGKGPGRRTARTLALMGLITVLAYATGGACGALAASVMHTQAVLLGAIPIVVALLLAHPLADDPAPAPPGDPR
ncbi:MAG: DUF1275 domain-containing protein [Actinomycetales bacterium]|nr:DUF1275 domain-containing protein [Actinomycetales bacterium]